MKRSLQWRHERIAHGIWKLICAVTRVVLCNAVDLRTEGHSHVHFWWCPKCSIASLSAQIWLFCTDCNVFWLRWDCYVNLLVNGHISLDIDIQLRYLHGFHSHPRKSASYVQEASKSCASTIPDAWWSFCAELIRWWKRNGRKSSQRPACIQGSRI